MQGERLETTQIQLQRRILFLVRSTRFLKFRVRFGPAFLSIKHDAVPERIAPGEMLRLSLGRQPKRLVNLVPLPLVDAAQKIDRPRHNVAGWPARKCAGRSRCGTHKTGSPRRTVAQVRPAHRWSRVRAIAILQRRHNHRAGANAEMDIAVPRSPRYSCRRKSRKCSTKSERDAHRLIPMMRRHHRENQTWRRRLRHRPLECNRPPPEKVSRAANKCFGRFDRNPPAHSPRPGHICWRRRRRRRVASQVLASGSNGMSPAITRWTCSFDSRPLKNERAVVDRPRSGNCGITVSDNEGEQHREHRRQRLKKNVIERTNPRRRRRARSTRP